MSDLKTLPTLCGGQRAVPEPSPPCLTKSFNFCREGNRADKCGPWVGNLVHQGAQGQAHLGILVPQVHFPRALVQCGSWSYTVMVPRTLLTAQPILSGGCWVSPRSPCPGADIESGTTQGPRRACIILTLPSPPCSPQRLTGRQGRRAAQLSLHTAMACLKLLCLSKTPLQARACLADPGIRRMTWEPFWAIPGQQDLCQQVEPADGVSKQNMAFSSSWQGVHTPVQMQ